MTIVVTRMQGGVGQHAITCCGHVGVHDWVEPFFGCGYHGCTVVVEGVGKCPSCTIRDCAACWGRGCECDHA